MYPTSARATPESRNQLNISMFLVYSIEIGASPPPVDTNGILGLLETGPGMWWFGLLASDLRAVRPRRLSRRIVSRYGRPAPVCGAAGARAGSRPGAWPAPAARRARRPARSAAAAAVCLPLGVAYRRAPAPPARRPWVRPDHGLVRPGQQRTPGRARTPWPRARRPVVVHAASPATPPARSTPNWARAGKSVAAARCP